MLKLFKSNKPNPTNSAQHPDFNYIQPNQFYFDSACQTLRPNQVIQAEQNYYHNYNSCGNRTKYKWGELVDQQVESCRNQLLNLTEKSSKDYAVIFTLNTTYAINLILHQINPKNYSQIITSDLEHNSVFLPTITYSKLHQIPRKVLPRHQNGSLQYTPEDLNNSITILNTTSNIDGRQLQNLPQIFKDLQTTKSLLLLDTAQNFYQTAPQLKSINFDALFSSGHKTYGSSIGFIIIKKQLITELNHFLTGGGTVTDVQQNSFTLINNPQELHSTLELGLQNWAGIIGLNQALTWLSTQTKNLTQTLPTQAQKIHQALSKNPRIKLLNPTPTTTISFHIENLDSHKLALILAEQNIMCRSGYFCCHYFLKNHLQLPPQIRISLGLHNTETQINHLLTTIEKTLTIF